MELLVQRLFDTGDATVGALFIDGVFECFTLEDEKREVKVKGETRIPAGEYEVTLRTEGGFHNRYKQKFGSMHKGMLHVLNVPNFKWILIHIGNTDKDTAGCLLVGESADKNGTVLKSTNAYRKMYPKIANALTNGEKVKIKYVDNK